MIVLVPGDHVKNHPPILLNGLNFSQMIGDALLAGQGIATAGGIIDTLSGGSRGYTSEGGITNIAPKTVTRGAPREVPNPYALPTIRAGY